MVQPIKNKAQINEILHSDKLHSGAVPSYHVAHDVTGCM